MFEAADIAAIDLVAAIFKALVLIALLQTVGLAGFAAVYRHHLLMSFTAIKRLCLVWALASIALVIVNQSLGAARMAGELGGLWDVELTNINWLSRGGAATLMRVVGLLTIVWSLRRGGGWIALLGGFAVVLSFALLGHATSHEHSLFLQILLVLHVTIAAFWFGALPALLIAAKRESTIDVVAAFSTHATILVPLLAVVGSTLVWLLLPGFSALATPYGWGLLIKVNGFGLLMLLAALNKLRLVPAMQRREVSALRAFSLSVRIEYALIIAVLCATAAITTLFSPD
jgi:putative copper resistance protein D